MGLLDQSNNDKEKESKVKRTIKKHAIAVLTALGLKLLPLLLAATLIVTLINMVIYNDYPKDTADKIYEKLEIEDVCDLVEIKGNDKDGYYLDFAEDVDKKLEDTIEYLNSNAGVKGGIDKDFLKKILKVEVATQFPDLGAKVDGDSGFQGIVDILRITPNKDINSLKNTGLGKETVKNQDDSNIEIANKDVIDKQEKIVKSWNKGKELTIAATATVYSQEDSKLHEGEKIDYWVAQKNSHTQNDLQISKGQTVTYTGKYSISVNKMTNEGLIYLGIEKDDIEGYIIYNFVLNDSNENDNITDNGEFEDGGYIEIDEEKVRDTIDSNVYKLTYIPKETFDKYIENSNIDALYHFTIDEDGNLITATWNVTEEGKLEITNNSAINLKSALQNYIIPYEYLLDFYIEADYESFSSDLADVALNSEIIMALEDNVTTTNVVETTEEKKVSESSEFSYDWTESNQIDTTTEYCSTNTEIIYADTWCVKLVNKDIFKEELLKISAGQPKNIAMPGTVTDTKSNTISDEQLSGEGTDSKEEFILDADGMPTLEKITTIYSYKTYQRTVTDTHSISNSYASSSNEIEPESKEKVFGNLYKKYQMYNRMEEKRFLQVLENDEKTANLVNLTKYLIYMATGTAYDGVIEYDFSEYEKTSFEDYSSYFGDYVVKTNDSNSAPVVEDKAELEKGLKKWLKDASNMKSNAISVLDTVFSCQEKYHVNAVFTYAFLRTETGIGTANTNYVKNDNNWGSWALGQKYSSPSDNIITITSKMESGNIYFNKGNISVSKIGAIYCPNTPEYPNQGDGWIKTVTNYMNDFYSAMGISPVASGGEGTIGVYTSSTGKNYNLYLQGSSAPWATEDYGDSHSMAMAGCGPTAAAIIASSYNPQINPSTVRQAIVSKYGLGNHSSSTYIEAVFEKMLPNVKLEVANFDQNKIKNCLQNSGQVWLVVQNCKYTSGAHCIALIDYKEPGMVYVAHGTAKTRPYGWDTISYLKTYNKYSQILYVGGK